jgi:hypothetical protein
MINPADELGEVAHHTSLGIASSPFNHRYLEAMGKTPPPAAHVAQLRSYGLSAKLIAVQSPPF